MGSLREIRLIRNGKEISSIDFYDYLLSGKKPKDEKLQLDDIIFIPKRKKSVTIGGEVSRPAIYELKDNESLDDLISIAGGLKITAYLKRVQIDRIVPFAQRDIIGMDRMFIDIDLSNQSIQKEPFKLMDGDYVQLFSILDLRLNVVQIAGSVVRPGRYDIGDSLSLSQLVIKADSLLGDAYLDRVDIVRIKPDQTEELIKLNLGKAINGDLANDIKLKSLDKVRVYSMTEMDPQKFVSIKGM